MSDLPVRCPECDSSQLKPRPSGIGVSCQGCGKLILVKGGVDSTQPPVDLGPPVLDRQSVGHRCPDCVYSVMELRKSGMYGCRECGLVRVIKDQTLEQLAPPETDEVPDMIEPCVGWRVWGVHVNLRNGELPILHSATAAHVWEPGIPTAAVCGRGNKHGPPCNGHGCGLYAAKTYKHLMGMSYPSYNADSGEWNILGEVNLWGKVVEGTQGWRAQYGYPKKLYVPFEANYLARPLHEAYGVPVALKNFLRDNYGRRA